jgi:arylsulfatase A-like enzyme
VDAASAWLQEHGQEPFFLFVHLWDAHFDFVPPKPFDARFGDPGYEGFVDGREFFFDERINRTMAEKDLHQLVALYDGEIMWCDAHVKRLLELLDDLELADDTIVAVTSDHGTEFFDHGGKGHRRTLYGEAIEIPLVIRAPGQLPAGVVVEDLSRMVDLGPTLMELSGLPPCNGVVGVSLASLATGEGSAPRAALSELLADQNRMRSVISGSGKLVWNEVTGDVVWFDLDRDPEERNPQRDLSQGLGPELLRALQGELRTIQLVSEQHQYPHQPIELPLALDQAIRASGYGGGEK